MSNIDKVSINNIGQVMSSKNALDQLSNKRSGGMV